MPLLENGITERAFEFIGAQLPVIIKDELADQAVKLSNPYLDAKVFRERLIPVDSSELTNCAVVNTMLARDNFDEIQTPLTNDGTHRYYVHAYVKADFTQQQRGDTAAYILLQRVLGVIKGILMAPQYLDLGFEPGVIAHRHVESIEIAQPSNPEESENMVYGRLTLVVRAPDHPDPESAVLINGNDTQVKLHETDLGYQYILDL